MQPCAPLNDGTSRVAVAHIAQRPPMPRLVRSRSRNASISRSEHQRTVRGDDDTDAETPKQDAEDDNSQDVPGGVASLRNTTGRQKAVLLALALADFFSSMSLSILAPFFPKEAAAKGVSEALSGWIFGVFALVQCFTSPLFAKMLPKTGGRALSLGGEFFAGGCTVLFGLLQFIGTAEDNTLFIVYCFILRMAMAVGSSAATTASFAIAAYAFPDNPTTVMGLLETAVGLGLMVGPALGGALYEVGGFYLPFLVIGSAMILNVPFYFCILPGDPVPASPEDKVHEASFLRMLKIPAVSITVFVTVIGSMTWVVLDPVLEPHLRMYDLTPTVVGMVFLLMAACYAVCSPIWGFVADNIYDSSPMMVIGYFFTGLGFMLLGPSPIFGMTEAEEPLYLNIMAITVIGLATSLALVPTYDKILDAGEKAGIEESLANYSAVAGLWNASYAFGEFLGPVMAGSLAGVIGFQWTMTLTACLCFLASFVMLILYLYERKYGPTGAPKSIPISEEDKEKGVDETTPLLR